MAGRRRAALPDDALAVGRGARRWRCWPRPRDGGQRHQALDLSVDRLGQGEGIELIPERDPRRDRRRIGGGACEQAVKRGPRRVVPPPEPGPDALLAHERDGWQEEILEQPELVAVRAFSAATASGVS